MTTPSDAEKTQLKINISEMARQMAQELASAKRKEAPPPSKPKVPDAEKKLWDAISSMDERALADAIESKADIGSPRKGTKELPLSAAARKRWSAGFGALLAAGAAKDAPKAQWAKGCSNLIETCASFDFIPGLEALWDSASEQEKERAAERLGSMEGLRFLTAKGASALFDWLNLDHLACKELDKLRAGSPMDNIDLIMACGSLKTLTKSRIWRHVIKLDDPGIFAHAASSGYAPHPDGSCPSIGMDRFGKAHSIDNFLELLVQSPNRISWRIAAALCRSEEFRLLLASEPNCMQSMAFCSDAKKFESMSAAGFDLMHIRDDRGNTPLHWAAGKALRLATDGAQWAEAEKILGSLAKACPGWLQAKNDAGCTPMEDVAANTPINPQGAERTWAILEKIAINAAASPSKKRAPPKTRL